MAARRVLSLIASRIPQNPLPRAKISSPCFAEVHRKFHPSPNTFSRDYQQYTRGFQSLAEASIPSVEKPSQHESISTTVKHQVKSNLKVSERHDLVMMFTCTVCDTRSIKTACRESYDKGVVLARCDGCNNTHLIADRLGWFGEPGSVEEFLAARGEEVKKGSSDTLNLTLEDFAGKKNLDVLVE